MMTCTPKQGSGGSGGNNFPFNDDNGSDDNGNDHSQTLSSGGCFAKDTATACRLLHPTASLDDAYAACYEGAASTAAELVRMASLAAGDLVLTASAGNHLEGTHVLAVQHAQQDAFSPMLTLVTSDGSSISLTPDHALFLDGKLAAAADASIGSALTTARDGAVAVVGIAAAERAIVNPVTVSGTLFASDGQGAPFLAASHPMWIAPLVMGSPLARTVVNAACAYVGDVSSLAQGILWGGMKLVATLGVVGFARRMVRATAK